MLFLTERDSQESRNIKITEACYDKWNSTRCAAIDLSVQTNARKLIGVLPILLTSKTVSHLLDFSMTHIHTKINWWTIVKISRLFFLLKVLHIDSHLFLVNLEEFTSQDRDFFQQLTIAERKIKMSKYILLFSHLNANQSVLSHSNSSLFSLE